MVIAKTIFLTLTFLILIAYFITNKLQRFKKKEQIRRIFFVIIIVCFFITSIFIIIDLFSLIRSRIPNINNLNNVNNVFVDFLEKNVFNPIVFVLQIVSTFFDGYAYRISRNEEKTIINDFELFFDTISIELGTAITPELVNVTFRCLDKQASIPSNWYIIISKLDFTISLDETNYKDPTYKTKFNEKYKWLLFRKINILENSNTKINLKKAGNNISFEFITKMEKIKIYDVLNKGNTFYSDVDRISLEMEYEIVKKCKLFPNIVSNEKTLFANYKRSPTEENFFIYD